MVDSVQPSRQKADLAEVVEMLLDKGVVINADIAVSVGDTQLLGIQLRAALASFETAAEYGLEFPQGTDMERVAAAVGDPSIAEDEPTAPIDATRGVNVSGEVEGEDGEGSRDTDTRSARPDPDEPTSGDVDVFDGGPLDTEESEDGETNEGSESDESDEGGEESNENAEEDG